MKQFHWKAVLSGALALALGAWAAPRLVRTVAPYQRPADRDLSGWGTLPPASAQRLQAALDGEVSRLRVPGLQAALITADGQTWQGASGTVDPERQVPLRRDHVLRIGSATKAFTAVVILQLVEEERLSLDDPLARWFPDFPNASAITLRQLLTHRSGLKDILENPGVMASLFLANKRWTPAEVVEVAAHEKLHAPPGAEYYYSNTNYVLLGLIAEQITGQTAAALIRQRSLSPLDLHDTYLLPNEPAPNLISNFDRDLVPWPGLYELTPANVSVASLAYTSGGMASTARDLVKFYAGLYSGRLLAPGSLDEMAAFLDARDAGTPQMTGYGLSLFRLEVGEEEVWASLGQFIGSMSIVAYSPGRRDIIAVIGNLSVFDIVSVWSGLSDAARTAEANLPLAAVP